MIGKKPFRHPLAVALSRMLILTALVLILVPLMQGDASTTILVDSFDDRIAADGVCTLREAIRAANDDKTSNEGKGECAAGEGADTILLPPGTYTLSRTDNGNEDAALTGDLDITADLLIQTTGPGTSTILAEAQFTDRIFQVLAGQVTMQGLVIEGASFGGDGAAIWNEGSLTLLESTLTGNAAEGAGGAIYNAAGGSVVILNSTVSGNRAMSEGGGIAHAGDSLEVRLSTVTDNTAASGGGIYAASSGVQLAGVVLAGNEAAGGEASDCAGLESGSLGGNLFTLEGGCPIAAGDQAVAGADVFQTVLGVLGSNGGLTPTHPLLDGSPAIDLVPTERCDADTDQRGSVRPGGQACDAGAYEVEDPLQVGPIFTVRNSDDLDDGACSFNHCSLREAIEAANARPNDAQPDQIQFALPAGGGVINPGADLPGIGETVVIDGRTQPEGEVVLDGGQAGAGSPGLVLQADGIELYGFTIQAFGADGIQITGGTGSRLEQMVLQSNGGSGVLAEGGGQNEIFDSEIFGNGRDGVTILSGSANRIHQTRFKDNAALAIDLAGDGITPDDVGDGDAGPNELQNAPLVYRATGLAGTVRLDGRLNSDASTAFELEFFVNAACDDSGRGEAEVFLGSETVTTDAGGNATFNLDLPYTAEQGMVITATATDPLGSTSEVSGCAVISAGNDSWPRSYDLQSGVSIDQFIDREGQSRWFRIQIQPGSKVVVTLTNLASNYDLFLYKDIASAYQAMTGYESTGDLVQLNAEFAPDVFTPDVFTPDVFTPDVFTPDVFTPDVFTPDVFTPDVFTPDVFTPDVFTPDVFTPDVFTPDVFTPDPSAFAAAQRSTLIGVSAFGGTTSEGIRVNTWNNSGDFYIRVRGRNGSFNLSQPFRLTAYVQPGSCSQVSEDLPASSYSAPEGGFRTILLSDLGRMSLTQEQETALTERFNDLLARPEVDGLWIDLGGAGFERVQAANLQAEMHPECPYAENLTAAAIKEIVDRVWEKNPLEYVVLVGNDAVIPFFRYPDQAGLANEANYVPPVRDSSSSQASLKLSYILGQDQYGASRTLSWKYDQLPLPDLGVGRLVEDAGDILAVVDAYLETPDGVITPGSSAVTGYDFLADAADAVRAELEAGIGTPAEALISPRELSPLDPAVWTADELAALLRGGRHDLIFLAGHFSASTTLAADYSTRLRAGDLADLDPDAWKNVLVFSAGCHSGYNIVNPHGIPGVTLEPDWAQAFSRLGATLIGGTGYQYGDTDFIEYSERLYLELSRQLRTGSGPVAIGQALSKAKGVYLAETPVMRPLHEKALLEATIFGLPMLRIDMPGARLTEAAPTPSIQPQAFNSDPGSTLGLAYADLSVGTNLIGRTQQLLTADQSATATVFYLEGPDGFLANTAEPRLPLQSLPVGVDGMVLRGVGFRGGSYHAITDVIPYVGSPTSELRGAHAPYLAAVYHPIIPWSVNYFAALSAGEESGTTLNLTPAQFISNGPGTRTGSFRAFDSMEFRLYYSDFLSQTATGNRPGLAASPAITSISADSSEGGVEFNLRVAGDPSAGVQQVWVTYTSLSGSFTDHWFSLDLSQEEGDSTRWHGTLELQGTPPEDLRFIAQAVNGVGMLAADYNYGAFFTPDVDPALGGDTPATLEFTSGPSEGVYSTTETFTALLRSQGSPLAGQPVTFSLGPQQRRALTDSDGHATVDLPIYAKPGEVSVRAAYGGDRVYAASSAEYAFTVHRQATTITLDPAQAEGAAGEPALVTASLTDAAAHQRPLRERTLILVLTDDSGEAISQAVITDYLGRAPLGPLSMPPGTYQLDVYFSGVVPMGNGETVQLNDIRYLPSTATGSVTLINRPPDCSLVEPMPQSIWSPDKELHQVGLSGVADPDGHPVTIAIDSIFQDEPVGTGKASPDGFGIGTDTAIIRAERDGNGNGRVYEVTFTASDPYGGSCSAAVVLGVVTHDQGGDIEAINDGAIYDSTVPSH